MTIARGTGRGDDNGAFLSLLLTAGIAGTGWLVEGCVRGFEAVTLVGLAWFCAAGVFTMFIGRVFLYTSVQHLGAMRASALKRFTPFFSVLLAVLVLHETLNRGAIAGMALIVASVVLLVRGAFRRDAGVAAQNPSSIGYLFGIASGLGYAGGSLLRKMGLADAPDALLGAAVGSMVGALLFAITALFHGGYARALRSAFGRPNPWLIAAGVASSCGQIFTFAALNTSPVSRVALIGSMEVFITFALAAIFLRKHEKLTLPVASAATLGVAGTALILGT